jgi:ABC-type glycerol-3-phosphate transport system substrate-binding protein
MKRLFIALFAILVLLSFVAWRIQPAPDGKLIWVSDDNPARRQQIALFNAEAASGEVRSKGVRLDPSNDAMEKVIVQSIGGVGPDLFDSYTGNTLAAFVRSGVALDVTDAFKREGLSLDAVWPSMRSRCVYNGRVYGWPTNAAADALFLNVGLFERAGVPLPSKRPWTWQEFLPLAQRLTLHDASGRTTQYGLLADWPLLWPMCVRQWGGHYYTADGTRCTLDSPDAIAGVQFAHDLIYKYRVMPSPVEEAAMSGQGGWGTGTINWFGAGRGAMAVGGRWWLCTLRDQTHPRHGPPALRTRVVECPHGPRRLFWAYGRATLINAASPRAREAVEFLRYMSRRPYCQLINAQADGVSAVSRFDSGPAYLRDPSYPEEQDNDVWESAMKAGVSEETSLFVDGAAVQRILNTQLDLVKTDQKPVAAAMRDATIAINAQIAKTVAEDPTLRRMYGERIRAAASHLPTARSGRLDPRGPSGLPGKSISTWVTVRRGRRVASR